MSFRNSLKLIEIYCVSDLELRASDLANMVEELKYAQIKLFGAEGEPIEVVDKEGEDEDDEEDSEDEDEDEDEDKEEDSWQN